MDTVSVDTRVPGVALVALAGEHELYGALKLQQQIDALIAEGVSIVIDLTETAFLDSSIVGVLLGAQKLAAKSHVDYTVVLSKSTGSVGSPDVRDHRPFGHPPARRAGRRTALKASRPRGSRHPGRGFRAGAAHIERKACLGRHQDRPVGP